MNLWIYRTVMDHLRLKICRKEKSKWTDIEWWWEDFKCTTHLMGWYWSETRLGGSFRSMKSTNAEGTISTICSVHNNPFRFRIRIQGNFNQIFIFVLSIWNPSEYVLGGSPMTLSYDILMQQLNMIPLLRNTRSWLTK